MKNIDRARKADCVDSAVRTPVLIVNHFEYTSAAEPLQGLGTRMLIAVLRIVDRKAHDTTNLVRKCPQIVP
jgi:hypothetical protein